MADLLNKTIFHYRILEKLGEGGMGVVYKAEDTTLQRYVALKFLPPHLVSEDEVKERFIVEARAASALEHSNICNIHSIGETPDGQTFICMAYYPGETLKEKINRGPLPVEEAVDIATQMIRGLSIAHRAGIIHRDIKPANIIITEQGEVKIVDFGLAKLAGQQISTSGGISGTVAYMSPEQLQNQPVDERSDIWAWGCVFYQMLTGALPFQGEFDPAIQYAILHLEPQPLNQWRSDIPPALVQIIRKALQKDIGKRYQSLSDIAVDLSTLNTAEPPRSLSPRSFKRVVIVVLLLILLFVGAYFGVDQWGSDTIPKTVTPVDPNRIAVLPFNFQGNGDLRYLQDGVSQLLSMNLDGSGELRSIDPNTLQKIISRDSLAEFDRENGQVLANRLGAGLFVLGNLTAMKDQVRINARVFPHNSGDNVAHTALVEGKPEDLFKLVDQLTAQLLGAIGQESVSPMMQFASDNTTSFAALKDFLNGERLFRKGYLDEAISTYKMAVQKDSTFALAYYRMALVTSYIHYRPINRVKALQAADRHREKLSYRHRLLLDAIIENINGSFLKAESMYRNIVNIYPDDVEAWRALGFKAYQYAGRLGRPLTEGIEAFQRALYYDPEDPPSLGALIELARYNQDRALSDSLSRRLIALMPDSPRILQNRAQLAFPGGDAATKKEILQVAKRAQPFELRSTVQALGRFTDVYQPTLQLCRILTEPGKTAYYRFQGYNLLAHLLFSRGQIRQAKTELDALATFDDWNALKYKAILLLTPLIQPDSEELLEISHRLNRLEDVNPPFSRVYQHYLTGLISVHLNAFSSALEQADKLEAYSRNALSNKRAGLMAADYARSIRAAAARQQGNFERTLSLLNASEPENWWTVVARDVIAAMSYEQYLRAESYRELGQFTEALRWYHALGYGGQWSFVYLPVSHLRQAEIYQETGNMRKALAHYRRFIDFWEDCDPELRYQVEEVRRRIASLEE